MTLNFKNHERAISDAYNKVATSKTNEDWLILDYEGNSNIIKVGDEGEDGLEEFANAFSCSRLQYGVTSVRLSPSLLPKIVLVHWQGENVPSARVAATTSHAGDVRRFLKTVHVLVYARSEMDVEPDAIRKEVSKLPGTTVTQNIESSYESPTVVGSVYTPVRPHVDLNVKAREDFWSKTNNEEETRKKEDSVVRAAQEKKWTTEREQLSTTIHEKLEEDMSRAKISNRPENVTQRDVVNGPKRIGGDRLGLFEAKGGTPLPQPPAKPSPVRTTISPTATDYRTHNGSPSTITAVNAPVALVPEPPSKDIPPPLPTSPVPFASPTKSFPPSSALYEEPPSFETIEDVKPVNDSFGAQYDLPPMISTDSTKAIALWDYQAMDETEITFDPEEYITDIEQIDVGWWKGRNARGDYGLFPANYVKLV